MDPSILTGIIAALVAGVIALSGALVVGWRGWSAGITATATMLAIAGGWIVNVGYHLPPLHDVNFCPSVLAQGGVLLTLVLAGWPGPLPVVRLALAAGLGAGIGTWLILHQLGCGSLPLAIGMALAIGGVAWGWENAGARLHPLIARGVLLIILIALTMIHFAGGSIKYGMQCAVLCAAVTAPLVIAWWRQPASGAASAALTAGAWLTLLAYCENDYTPGPNVALLPCVPPLFIGGLAGWVALLPGLRTRPRLANALALAVAVIAAALAVGWMALYGQPADHSAGAAED